MHGKWQLVYLDVMAGPGRCKIAESGEEFPGSPFVALEHGFDEYLLIEEDPGLVEALKERVKRHPKASRVQVISKNWITMAESGGLNFNQKTLVVAFIDPTGISQVPISAMRALAKNPKIDLLLTIQHSLGITWNVPQYLKSSREQQTALDKFLGMSGWRDWKTKTAGEFAQKAVKSFCESIEADGFIGTRHISVPEDAPLYRFTLFSRHPLAKKFWNEILQIDEKGQREWKF
jgi:three-Cys-motif partner protein